MDNEHGTHRLTLEIEIRHDKRVDLATLRLEVMEFIYDAMENGAETRALQDEFDWCEIEYGGRDPEAGKITLDVVDAWPMPDAT